MIYNESPNTYETNDNKLQIFIAGGITGCPQWQPEFVEYLKDTDLVIHNPRRSDYGINDINQYNQIQWEFKYLKESDFISFWFCKETLCPIVLYELGRWSCSCKPLFVGIHPDYARKTDVILQLKLARPDIKIVYSLKDLANEIIDHISIFKDIQRE